MMFAANKHTSTDYDDYQISMEDPIVVCFLRNLDLSLASLKLTDICEYHRTVQEFQRAKDPVLTKSTLREKNINVLNGGKDNQQTSEGLQELHSD